MIRFSALIALGLVALPSGAAAQEFASGAMPIGNVRVPVASMLDRRFAGVVRQRYDFSCGSAALATLLRYHYDRRVDEEHAFRGMWAEGDRPQIRKVGFSLLDMKRYLAAHGLAADGYRVSLDQVAETAIPGIALITVKNYKHFVVVKGVTADEVLVGDPSRGVEAMDREAFEEAWNGVYFVLNSEQPAGQRAFNRTAQWASFPRAPAGGRFLDPISLQALALTAPFYRDF